MEGNSIQKKKATMWGITTLFFALGLNLISIVLRVLDTTDTITLYDLPQPIVIVVFMLVSTLFYFLPMMKTHYHAKQAGVQWLYILSKVLIIHFCATAAFAMVILFINLILLVR